MTYPTKFFLSNFFGCQQNLFTFSHLITGDISIKGLISGLKISKEDVDYDQCKFGSRGNQVKEDVWLVVEAFLLRLGYEVFIKLPVVFSPDLPIAFCSRIVKRIGVIGTTSLD